MNQRSRNDGLLCPLEGWGRKMGEGAREEGETTQYMIVFRLEKKSFSIGAGHEPDSIVARKSAL